MPKKIVFMYNIYKLYEKHLHKKYGYCYVVSDLLWKRSLHKRYATYKQKRHRFAGHYLQIRWKMRKISRRFFEYPKQQSPFCCWIGKLFILKWFPVCCRCWWNSSQNYFRLSIIRKASCCQCWWYWCFMCTDTSLEKSSKYFRTMKGNRDNCHNL